MKKPTSQKEAVLNHLIQYGEITPDQARDEYGCRRLAPRIGELRKDGIAIETHDVKFVNRFGHRGEFAKYVLLKTA